MARSRVARVPALALIAMLASCQHQQFVSPYSADLQARAADMLADIVAWEGQMRANAGTQAADPRNPAIQAKLARWDGDIEAMAAIELSIDPGSTDCDKVAGQIATGIHAVFATTSPPLAGNPQLSHCETLPDTFTRIRNSVAGIGVELDQQCKLPISDSAFSAALKDPSAQPSLGVKTGCAALFTPLLANQMHGPAIDSLATELDSIIYREGRQAPPSAS